MNILITGAGGQVGQALLKTAPAGLQAIGLNHRDLNLEDSAAIDERLDATSPKAVINAAAYTAVDQAESEPERAYAINAEAVKTLAQACGERKIRLVHISTDFVFDGAHGRPYLPGDATAPLNVYGASKLAGEGHVAAQSGLDWRIVRTAWVYAATGRNFLLTMMRLFRERPVVRVVADQVGTPTSANSLARCLWSAAVDEGASGILHFTDAGVASWYDFAVAIYEEAREQGLLNNSVQIEPIRSDAYRTAATRPAYSVLDKEETMQRLRLTPVHWRSSLREVLRGLRA